MRFLEPSDGISRLALTFLFSIALSNVFAQLGMRFALNLPDWAVSSNNGTSALGPIDPQSYPGFQIYLVYDNFKGDNKSIGVELGYTQRGFKAQNLLGYGNDEIKFQLDYLDFMLPAKFRIGSGQSRFLIEFGPYAGYAVDGKIIADVAGQKSDNSINFNELQLQRFDWGIIMGLGPSFKTRNNEIISFTFRYSYGFQNLNNGSDSDEVRIRNVGLNFGMAFCFDR